MVEPTNLYQRRLKTVNILVCSVPASAAVRHGLVIHATEGKFEYPCISGGAHLMIVYLRTGVFGVGELSRNWQARPDELKELPGLN